MTKEQIYVHIKSEDEAKRAKDILEKWGEKNEVCFVKEFPFLFFGSITWDLCNDSFFKFSKLTQITLDELDQLLAQEHGMCKENLQVPYCSGKANSSFNPQPHYKNDKKEFRSIYELQTVLDLNSYEFDILKRLVRCRKKGQFAEDLQKIKDTVDIYLNEFKG